MRRFCRGRGLRVLVATLAIPAAIFFALSQTPPVNAAPARQAAAAKTPAQIKSGRIDYVEASAFFRRFQLKAAWVFPGRVQRFQGPLTTVDLEADKREALINGKRVYLGEPVMLRGEALYLTRIDAEKLFDPILRPATVAVPAPALKVIVLDPGHGGQDTGTRNSPLKLNEKTFTLDVAQRVKKLLQAQGYKVLLTRTDDRFIPLPERADIANRAGADLFISIHFNSVPNAPAVRGTETYTMTPRYQKSTGSAARDKTDDDLNPGNLYDPWNALLGYAVHQHLLSRLATPDRGLKRARFAVLRLVKSPAVLVEAGYLSNDAEARKIATAAYRQDIAEGIVAGVGQYARAITTAKMK